MGRRRYRDYDGRFKYVEAVTVGRHVGQSTQSALRLVAGRPTVTDTRFAVSMGWDDFKPELEDIVERSFDAWLYFTNSGPREVGFRIPTRLLPAHTTAPFVVGDILHGVAAEVSGKDLLLRFRMYAEDSAGFNLQETGERWLGHIIPVREELISGRLDALELGPMIGTFADHIPGEPDLPAGFGLSKATRILAAYLLVAPQELARWAADRAESRSGELSPDWLATCAALTPVARWEFVAADARQSFQIRLGRLPQGTEFGAWYVTATDPRSTPLAFETEEEARRGYHDEALRLQRFNDPGRWRELTPD